MLLGVGGFVTHDQRSDPLCEFLEGDLAVSGRPRGREKLGGNFSEICLADWRPEVVKDLPNYGA
jgi:hypothetical protein